MRPWRAFIIAPLTAPIVYWLEMPLERLVREGSARGFLGPSPLPIMILVAAPFAYGATLVAGVPLYLVARDRRLRFDLTVALGALLGAVMGVLLQPGFRGELFSVLLGPWRGALMGGATAAVWHLVLGPRPGPRDESDA